MKKAAEAPRDIYRALVTKDIGEDVNLEAIADKFADSCRDLFIEAFAPEQPRAGRLRMSSIGKPDRQIWHEYQGTLGEKTEGHTYVKFLYGHLTEALLIALCRAAGHSIENEQMQVEVDGVKGHIDFHLDGVLADAKSASPAAFKKFRDGSMPKNDPFGYVGQIKGYAEGTGDREIGWLAMDKQNGHICWLGYNLDNLPEDVAPYFDYDIRDRIADVKKLVGSADLPLLCYEPVPEGASGNMKLAQGCSYCQFKHQCFDNLRVFLYAQGPRYLTEVKKAPRVMEVPSDF